MANLNRIKVVLVEKGKTGKWLAEEIGNPKTVLFKHFYLFVLAS